jgi:hypothetical protein
VDTTERGDKRMFDLVKTDGGPPNRECVDMLKKSNTYTKEIS